MSCFTGDKGKQALVAFVVLVLVQLSLVVGLLVLGAKGKEEIGTERETGVPYYIGAIVVGSVFLVPVVSIIAVIILSSLDEEYCITDCLVICSCLFNFFGILACILGMIFVIAFGIANCKKQSGDYTDAGFCSYDTNIDTNYTVAVVALVLILLMLISTCFSFYMYSKHSDALVSRKDPSFTRSSNVAPSNLTTSRQQQRRQDYPGPTAPPLYSIQNEGCGGSAYPPNTGTHAKGFQEPPPSYESVMYNAASSQPRAGSHNTPSNTHQQNLTRDTQRRMIQDRERRLDLDRQRRLGVPENRLIRKFFGKLR